MRIDFTKMHGVGNDFVVFDAPAEGMLLQPERLRALADRRTGIGFDQALVLGPAVRPSTASSIPMAMRLSSAAMAPAVSQPCCRRGAWLPMAASPLTVPQ